jgi:tetratricopeptide (TPR) repeat protein
MQSMNSATDPFQIAWQAQQAGDLQKAEEGYRKLLRTHAKDMRVWLALVDICESQGRFAEAAAYIRQAIENEPKQCGHQVRLGNILLKQDKYAEAEPVFRRALELDPNHVEALVNLGYAIGELERYEEAIAIYRRALALSPNIPEAHHNLANIFRELKRLDEAMACYNEALRLRPDYAKAHINKGVALVARGDVSEAVGYLRRGVELMPNLAEAHNSFGSVLSAQGDLDAAEAEFDRAIQLKPDYPDANWNRSLHWLLRGNYELGWPAYEWRWRCKRPSALPKMSKPRWDGASLHNRTILLYAEQGLGDTLQFVRYAPMLKARGAKVILQCQGALIPLLSRCEGIDELVAWGAPVPACDVWLPLMSVPAVVRTTLATIPAKVPYLFANPALVDYWRRELAPIAGLRVGITWQGSKTHAWDRHRSVSLSVYEPLARIQGVRLISLQKGNGAEQIQENAGKIEVLDLGDRVDRTNPFADTAAIIQNLDVVVAIDSAIAHLAGGLGAPVWIALHKTPDWRWLVDRLDSPWYPTARLFRQTSVGDWGPVFQSIAEAIPTGVLRRNEIRPLLVEVSAGELLDKLAILRIKSERITDADKSRNVRSEMAALSAARAGVAESSELNDLELRLKQVNERLWDIEDEIRLCEQKQEFGPQFLKLARSVYHVNDERAAIKRAINQLLQSRLVEEKSYAGTGSPTPAG